MFDLPADFDEAELLGHVLEMVCIGPYFTRLEFSKASSGINDNESFYVGVKGSVFMRLGAQKVECCADNPKDMVRLVDLLLLEVKGVRRQGASSLEMLFDGDRGLILNGEGSPDFEAYTIQVFGRNVVVV